MAAVRESCVIRCRATPAEPFERLAYRCRSFRNGRRERLDQARGNWKAKKNTASREATSCTPSVEARAAANPIGERDAVARRGGAVRRAAQAADPHFLPDRRTEAEIAAALITSPTADQAHLG